MHTVYLDESGTALARLSDDHLPVAIEHRESNVSPQLQIADYLAWAVRRKYETDDREGYDLIRTRIVLETVVRAK